MINLLKGKVITKHSTHIVMSVGAIGFEINMSLNGIKALPSNDKEIQLFTYLHVREDLLNLYGFLDLNEKKSFILLTSINGIGPKLALTILSGIKSEKLKERVINGDISALTNVPGVGLKTAKRIIIELKEEFIKSDETSIGFDEFDDLQSQIFKDTVNALVSLGYKRNHASDVCKDLQKNNELDGELESVIKKALKLLI